MKIVKVLKLSNDKRYKFGKVYRLKSGLLDREVLEKLGYELICVDSVSTVYKNWSDNSVVSSHMSKGEYLMDGVANQHYKYEMY
jgi:hypothetical protein